MDQITKTAPKSKTKRTVRFERPHPGMDYLMAITEQRGQKKNETDFWVRKIEGGYRLIKFFCDRRDEHTDPGVYHVQLCGRESTCECLGYLRWTHCRHIEALLALEKAEALQPEPTCPF